MKINDDAVSPVVGVMLMLVITIVIAAIVSVFAGGVIADVEAPSQTTFTVKSTIDQISDSDKTNAVPDNPTSANNGIRFTVAGGESIFLDDLTIQLSDKNSQMKFTTRTAANASSIFEAPVLTNYEGQKTHFSTGGSLYTELNAGDYFVLLADSCYDSTLATDAEITKGRFLVWNPDDFKGTFEAQIGKSIEYSIIDTSSGSVLQRGTVKI